MHGRYRLVPFPVNNPTCPRIERIGRPWASWLCLVGGLCLLAMVVLIPPWISVRHLTAHRDALAAQLQNLHHQHEFGQRLVDALRSDDPVALELLAYRGLGLKPAGAELFNDERDRTDAVSLQWPHRNASASGRPLPRSPALRSRAATEDSWLVQLANGPQRIALGVTASMCLGLGLLLAIRRPQD